MAAMGCGNAGDDAVINNIKGAMETLYPRIRKAYRVEGDGDILPFYYRVVREVRGLVKAYKPVQVKVVPFYKMALGRKTC